jgi:hypothetical protein
VRSVRLSADPDIAPTVAYSGFSAKVDVAVKDPAPPTAPVLSFDGYDGEAANLSWSVADDIRQYMIQRRSNGSPAWTTQPSWIFVAAEGEGQGQMSLRDDSVQSLGRYEYRLLVVGANGKRNTQFRVTTVDLST